MKIKLIGLGQCGSFVVYDEIASIFDQKTSKDIRTIQQSHWKHDYESFNSALQSGGAASKMNLRKYFEYLKIPDLPQFFVIDSNRKNAVVDGLQGQEINRKLAPLRILARPLALSKRNNGCTLGQIGEYVFRSEKTFTRGNNIFKRLNHSGQMEINALIFAGGGGSGSGGAPVLNEELHKDHKDSVLFNLMVLPPYYISDRRQIWNTGRCIMRLASIGKQTSLLLFSNLSESLDDQYYVNEYIRKLIVRLAHFGYTGNIPKVATDIDKKDLQVFFSGNPAFVGMSSLKKDAPSNEDLEKMVEQACAPRGKQGNYGLSIVLPKSLEQEQLNRIRKVMIVIGLPPSYVEKANSVYIIKRKIAERLGTKLSNLDCCAYSYTSSEASSEVELTIFFRHNNYQTSYLLYRFLKGYMKWHKDERNEFEYLTKEVDEQLDNNFLKDVRKAIEAESNDNDPDWLKNNFSQYKIIEVP
jgi:hypothetical protein